MESFQCELSRDIKQYDRIQGNECEKIINHIIKQYQKIDEPAFQTGCNMRILPGPKLQAKYVWLSTLLVWTNGTHHDLVSRNLWPRPEVVNIQQPKTMPMHENRWGWAELCHQTMDGPQRQQNARQCQSQQLQQLIDQLSAMT
jgi:hypothetical protein